MRNIRALATTIAMATGLLVFGSCGGSSKRTADLLYDVRAYNEGIRWQKFPQSAVRILPAARDHFLDVREDLEEDLRVDEYEITRMKVTGKDKGTARVQVKWTWHMDSKGIVHKTTTSQKWKRFGKRWMMLQEFHVRGEEMPGVEEEPEEELDSEGNPEPADPEADEEMNSEAISQLNVSATRLANQRRSQ